MEPSMTIAQRNHSSWKGSNDSLKKYYDPAVHKDLDYQFGNGQSVINGQVNAAAAPNLSLFQKTSSIASKILWLIPFLLFLRSTIKRVSYPVFQRSPKSLSPEFSF